MSNLTNINNQTNLWRKMRRWNTGWSHFSHTAEYFKKSPGNKVEIQPTETKKLLSFTQFTELQAKILENSFWNCSFLKFIFYEIALTILFSQDYCIFLEFVVFANMFSTGVMMTKGFHIETFRCLGSFEIPGVHFYSTIFLLSTPKLNMFTKTTNSKKMQ
jgi:hypothetical protein